MSHLGSYPLSFSAGSSPFFVSYLFKVKYIFQNNISKNNVKQKWYNDMLNYSNDCSKVNCRALAHLGGNVINITAKVYWHQHHTLTIGFMIKCHCDSLQQCYPFRYWIRIQASPQYSLYTSSASTQDINCTNIVIYWNLRPTVCHRIRMWWHKIKMWGWICAEV